MRKSRIGMHGRCKSTQSCGWDRRLTVPRWAYGGEAGPWRTRAAPQPPGAGCGCRAIRAEPAVGQAALEALEDPVGPGLLEVPAATAASRSALTALTIASLTVAYGTFCAVAMSLSDLPSRNCGPHLGGRQLQDVGRGGQPVP